MASEEGLKLIIKSYPIAFNIFSASSNPKFFLERSFDNPCGFMFSFSAISLWEILFSNISFFISITICWLFLNLNPSVAGAIEGMSKHEE